MFKALFKAEFAATKNISFLLLAGNFILFVLCSYNGMSTYTYAGMSTFVFWIAIVSCYVSFSDQKRTRLYTQLPTTHFEVFFSAWLVILLWLVFTVVFWLLFGITFDAEFSNAKVLELITGALGILMMTVLISIAIDLSAFKPRSAQWVYITALILFVGLSVNLKLTSFVGISIQEDSFSVYPFSFETFGPIGILYAAATCALFFYANYKVYEKSESFLH